jgi:hypothetical protein
MSEIIGKTRQIWRKSGEIARDISQTRFNLFAFKLFTLFALKLLRETALVIQQLG